MNNNKGFTLIEVILGVTLTSIVLMGVGSILLTSNVQNRHIQDQTTSQQYTEIVISELRNTCYDASQIREIKDVSGSDALSSTSEIEMGEMVISKTAKDAEFNSLPESNATKKYYKYDPTTKQLSVKNSESEAYATIASNIESIKVLPLPKGATPDTTFENCTGIELTVDVKTENKGIKKDSEISVQTQYYFRNADYRF